MIRLAGLEPPRGRTAAARRNALLGKTDRELGERVAAMAKEIRAGLTAPSIDELARFVALPQAETFASPFGLRMVAMAAIAGATTTHQELRADVASRSSRRARTRDARHETWDGGFLHAGKYQQFGLEDPHAVFHPSHTSKWGPHELMHRAVGFFFRRGATRFELYLGARLNELVPVVTWYGPEQAMRLREGRFDRERAGNSPVAEAGEARWLMPRRFGADELELAGALLREGLEHFERELDAIDREIATGEIVRVRHPFLDASSDAAGYVDGHATFLGSDGAARVIEAFAREGVERWTSIAAFRDHVERVFDELLFEPVTFRADEAARERDARHVWDHAQRCARIGGRAMTRIDRAIDDLAATAERARRGGAIDLDAVRTTIADRLGDDAARVLAIGVQGLPAGVDLERLAAGLGSTCGTLAPRADLAAVAELLATSDAMLQRRTLPERVARALHGVGEGALADAASFDAALARASRSDAVADSLIEDATEASDSDRLVASRAFELLALDHDPLGSTPDRARPSAWLVGRRGDELVVVPIPIGFGAVFLTIASAPRRRDEVVAEVRAKLRLSAARAGALLDALVASGALANRALPAAAPAPSAARNRPRARGFDRY